MFYLTKCNVDYLNFLNFVWLFSDLILVFRELGLGKDVLLLGAAKLVKTVYIVHKH